MDSPREELALRPRRRWPVVLLVLGLAYLLGLVLWFWAPLQDDSLSRLTRAAEPPPPPSVVDAPSPRRGQAIVGRVVGLKGNLRGLEVVAFSERRADLFGGLDCRCPQCAGGVSCACGSGAPELGRRLRARPSEARPHFGALASGTGAFRVEVDPAADSYTLWVEAPGRGFGVLAGVRPGEENVELGVTPGRMLEGRVLEEDGRPASGVVVSAVDRRGHRAVHAASGDDGRFRLGPLAAGVGWTVVASVEGLPPASVELSSPPWPDAVLRLQRFRRLEGRVVQAGHGVANIRVELQGQGCTLRAVSGLDGRFAFDQVRPGVYRVLSSRGVIHRQDEVSLPVGQGVVELELDPP